MIKTGYDRITEILSPFSGISRVNPAVLARASARGSYVHALCQGVIDGIDITIPKTVTWTYDGVDYEEDIELKGYVESFQQWAEGKKFLANPGRMYCDKWMITGECDGLFQTDKGIVLFDLKTSVAESTTWRLQGAAYAMLCQLQGISTLCQDFIRLSKDGKRAKEHSYFYEHNIETFFKCVDLYRTFFKNKNVINEEYL